jgi:alpha-beta hydrolase superfamily lysophospholipase
VIAELRADGRAAPEGVLIQGVSLGAVVGALVAADDPSIAGLVLISGLYDLPAFLARPDTLAEAQIKVAATLQSAGGTAALKARSALHRASDIKASTLLLNGAKDDRTDPDQARRFARAVEAHGGEARVRIYPAYGHEIPLQRGGPKWTLSSTARSAAEPSRRDVVLAGLASWPTSAATTASRPGLRRACATRRGRRGPGQRRSGRSRR